MSHCPLRTAVRPLHADSGDMAIPLNRRQGGLCFSLLRGKAEPDTGAFESEEEAALRTIALPRLGYPPRVCPQATIGLDEFEVGQDLIVRVPHSL